MEMLVAPPLNKHTIVHKDGDTKDIIDTIMMADKEAYKSTINLAKKLKGSSVYESAKNIFGFVFTNIKYKLDPFGKQNIKSPSQTYYTGFADCKSLSIFSASLLKNLNIPYKYRFASYKEGSKEPTHVYIIAIDELGNEIIIDTVWKKFNSEKPYKYKKDMTQISYISGIDNPEIGRFQIRKPAFVKNITKQTTSIVKPVSERFQKVASNPISTIKQAPVFIPIKVAQKITENRRLMNPSIFQNLKNQSQRTAKTAITERNKTVQKVEKKVTTIAKNAVEKIKGVAPEILKSFLRVGAGPARLAFMGLVRLNWNSWGSVLNLGFISKDEAIRKKYDLMAYAQTKAKMDKLLEIWENLGGKRNEIISAAHNGAKLKPFLFIPGVGSTHYIGEPITIASMIATATGIVATITEFLGPVLQVAQVAVKVKDVHDSVKEKVDMYDERNAESDERLLENESQKEDSQDEEFQEEEFQDNDPQNEDLESENFENEFESEDENIGSVHIL